MSERAVDRALDQAADALADRPGYFIAFEGGDGSGKTTQAELLTAALSSRGVAVVPTREPGGTPLGTEIRRLVMHGPEDVDPRTEALLYAADRAYHAATRIRPALAAGQTVITDRYVDSSIAYQGAGRGLGAAEVRELSRWATGDLWPDLVIVLDIDAGTGLSRVGESRDRLENAGEDFHASVGEHYRRAAAADPARYRLVAAAGSPAQVFAAVAMALAGALGAESVWDAAPPAETAGPRYPGTAASAPAAEPKRHQ